MMSDEVHKEKMMSMIDSSGETKEQWFERMQKKFDTRLDDK